MRVGSEWRKGMVGEAEEEYYLLGLCVLEFNNG